MNAETLHFSCHPKNKRETPYRNFSITIFNADSRDPQSEITFSIYKDQFSETADDAGLLNGFAKSETYSTHVTSRYRNITINGGYLGITWQRDTLQLQKRRGSEYRGSFYFPEGSEQLDLNWNSTLFLTCQRL